jgi:hypothetical protein
MPLRPQLLKIASDLPQGDPTRREILVALEKEARGLGLSQIKDGKRLSLESGGVYAHVWFDKGVAQTDAGVREPDSGEWQVILSTSPDPLNLKPRGRELARKEFRYADPKMRGGVLGMAEDYIKRMLSRLRGKTAAISGRGWTGRYRDTYVGSAAVTFHPFALGTSFYDAEDLAKTHKSALAELGRVVQKIQRGLQDSRILVKLGDSPGPPFHGAGDKVLKMDLPSVIITYDPRSDLTELPEGTRDIAAAFLESAGFRKS